MAASPKLHAGPCDCPPPETRREAIDLPDTVISKRLLFASELMIGSLSSGAGIGTVNTASRAAIPSQTYSGNDTLLLLLTACCDLNPLAVPTPALPAVVLVLFLFLFLSLLLLSGRP